MSLAADHGREAAARLRGAITIADPYRRADAIWEATLRLRAAGDRLWGRRGQACDQIAWRLEEGCEAAGDPPEARFLMTRLAGSIVSSEKALPGGGDPSRLL